LVIGIAWYFIADAVRGDEPSFVAEVSVTLAAGAYHSLVITKDGYVYAFGRNHRGQLGIGNTQDSHVPVLVANDIVSVAVGAANSLVLQSNGIVLTVGDNMRGQLVRAAGPNISASFGAMHVSTPVFYFAPGVRHVTYIHANEFAFMMINEHNQLMTWGDSLFGRLGRNSRRDGFRYPFDGAAMAAFGDRHTVVLDLWGNIWAWGYNHNGQLGDGGSRFRSAPFVIEFPDKEEWVPFIYVAVNKNSNFAIDANGTLWAWGENGAGQLGNGLNADRNTPVRIMENIVSVAAGRYHTLAVTEDGRLYAWGSHGRGQLGIGNAEGLHNRHRPQFVMDNVAMAAAGDFHSFAVTLYGELFSFGGNEFGQLGLGHTRNVFSPEFVMDNIKIN